MGGLITDLVLVTAGAVLPPAFDDLYRHVKAAVHAWSDHG